MPSSILGKQLNVNVKACQNSIHFDSHRQSSGREAQGVLGIAIDVCGAVYKPSRKASGVLSLVLQYTIRGKLSRTARMENGGVESKPTT